MRIKPITAPRGTHKANLLLRKLRDSQVPEPLVQDVRHLLTALIRTIKISQTLPMMWRREDIEVTIIKSWAGLRSLSVNEWILVRLDLKSERNIRQAIGRLRKLYHLRYISRVYSEGVHYIQRVADE